MSDVAKDKTIAHGVSTMMESTFSRVIAAIRATAQQALPEIIEPGHSLVYDLGFDSMGVALLSIGLEDQFSFPVLLDTWIGEQEGPNSLTVGSLHYYMESLVGESSSSVSP
jgi:acyl carrier protein